jgi:hypothetical protein
MLTTYCFLQRANSYIPSCVRNAGVLWKASYIKDANKLILQLQERHANFYTYDVKMYSFVPWILYFRIIRQNLCRGLLHYGTENSCRWLSTFRGKTVAFIIYPEDGGSMFFRNVGNRLPKYFVQSKEFNIMNLHGLETSNLISVNCVTKFMIVKQ